ncbi:transporter substrate-binding domain-containing protein [Pseudomonas sp. HR96]|uniref:substrate-binding periplasmic protein n=1 Tax=Pseudomonas sp. HR96 TaxID=1027966 RepID=UPI002A75E1F8|nr:transporter substrate-binding domain-containing protein [Pseudomonas sp. HR96]WPP00266.1 transporter substrate-binding domain-containing protein [Pseudomonas sp. HR96]
MSHLLRACCLLGILLGASHATAENLRLVADAWPPFTDAGMANGGLATQIVTTALQRAGYGVDFEQVPWARALLGVGEGRYDILVNAWYSDERTRIGQFSAGYLVNRIVFIKRRDTDVAFNGDYTSLHPYPIAVVRGYAYSQGFDSDEQMQKVPVHNFPMAVRMLAAGRVQLTLDDELVARYYLSRESPKVRNSVEFLPRSLTENQLRILVSLKNPDHDRIVAGFDRQITAMKADGTYARLLKEFGM